MQLVPTRPQAAPDSLAADTVTLAERLRADSTLHVLSNPSELGTFFAQLRAGLADSSLWLGLLGTLLHVVLILLLAWLALRLIDRGAKRWMKRFEEFPAIHPRRQRAYTIGNLLMSAARYVIWPIALITILSEVNIDIGALLATAGVAGLAIGFGAQTLVKDVISGVFLLFDDTLHVGDLVRIGSDIGTVEFIGVRLIKVRKFDGEMIMVPAGELRIFGNRSIGFARALVEVGLSYEQDIDAILPVMQQVVEEWAAERPEILLEEAPQVQALMALGDSGVVARIVVQVVPGEQYPAERALRLRLKRRFDELGIEIPFPRRTVYMRQETDLPKRTITAPPPPAEDDEPLGSE